LTGNAAYVIMFITGFPEIYMRRNISCHKLKGIKSINRIFYWATGERNMKTYAS